MCHGYDVKLIRFCTWHLNCGHVCAFKRVDEVMSGGKPLQERVWIYCLSVFVAQSVKRSPPTDLCVCKRKIRILSFEIS